MGANLKQIPRLIFVTSLQVVTFESFWTIIIFLMFSVSVFSQARVGEYSSCLKGNVLASLLDAGLLFLLRFSLDDSVEGVMSAAVRALRALLVSTEDEVRGKYQKRFQLETREQLFGITGSIQKDILLFVLRSYLLNFFFLNKESMLCSKILDCVCVV